MKLNGKSDSFIIMLKKKKEKISLNLRLLSNYKFTIIVNGKGFGKAFMLVLGSGETNLRFQFNLFWVASFYLCCFLKGKGKYAITGNNNGYSLIHIISFIL